MDFLAYFPKSLQAIFEKIFSKNSKILLRKLLKMDYLSYFSKTLTNSAFIFCVFDEKRYLQEIFEKIFENFQSISEENRKKAIILAYFFQRIKQTTH